MHRKDYIAIANAIAGAKVNLAAGHAVISAEEMRKLVAECVADVMDNDNPNFKRIKFLVACGVR